MTLAGGFLIAEVQARCADWLLACGGIQLIVVGDGMQFCVLASC